LGQPQRGGKESHNKQRGRGREGKKKRTRRLPTSWGEKTPTTVQREGRERGFFLSAGRRERQKKGAVYDKVLQRGVVVNNAG